MSCTSRGPTSAETTFHEAFSSMRDIDRILWHISTRDSLRDPEGSRMWGKREIRDLVEMAKSRLDSMLTELDKEP